MEDEKKVNLLSNAPQCHDSYKKFYSFGRKKVHRIFLAGLVTYGMDGAFFKCFKNTKVKVLKLKITRKQYNKLKSVLNNYETNAELYKYDIKGLFVRLFSGKVLRRDKYYVCSVFVADVLKKAKIYDFGDIGRVKAYDFTVIPNTEIIYEGVLQKIRDN